MSNSGSRDSDNGEPVTNYLYPISIFYGGLVTGVGLKEVPKNAISYPINPLNECAIDSETDYEEVDLRRRANFTPIPAERIRYHFSICRQR